ncbi:signal peptidase I [Novosphingobium sp. AP12]|uniref:signal peptidase I n=1 Tax=Novosphingobium sp. AP12 TaxID=1144305 RepID=UPI0002721EA1|nr:signal peptidase I [Novosphingobium sp. AP12]EJL32177.1 signal peptidase I [Novosphingobium sp. AP12]
MSDTHSATKNEAADTASAAPGAKPAAPPQKDESFFSFLAWLVLGVLILRSFIISPFNIPSESMLPRLLTGDYLFATKWSYGFSKYSLPFSVPLIPGRILASQPDRGDVVIFKAPPGNDVDYIKRVIGLPGDEIQMRGGQVWLNGKAIPKVKVADFLVPVSPNTDCGPGFDSTDTGKPGGVPVCRYPQFRETLPGGKTYTVLDMGQTPQDDTGVFIVPEDHMFLMGDNRDNSMDSRFPAIEGAGIGIVPQENLVGKASIMMFSTDGSSEWIKPWTWFTAARWSRIGSVI